jgi:transposase, IS5 family
MLVGYDSRLRTSSMPTTVISLPKATGRGWQMVDATIVPVPTQRNSREENEAVKAGRIPGEQVGKIAPEGPRGALDEEAWQAFFWIQEPCECGCQAQADPALRGDRCGSAQKLDELLTKGNSSADGFGDSAYRSRRSRSDCAPAASRAVFICGPLAITRCRKRKRMRTATEAKFAPASSTCSQLSRLRWGGRIVRTIGIVRARAKIGLQNLAYNIRRLVTLEQIAAA